MLHIHITYIIHHCKTLDVDDDLLDLRKHVYGMVCPSYITRGLFDCLNE